MIQKSIAIFLLVAGFSNSLYATNMFMRPKVLKSQTNQPYADFNGTWSSPKCMGGPLTLKIEQTPNDISFDNGELMEIGTMITKSSSGRKFLASTMANSEISSLEWNASKTTLTIRAISVHKGFAEETIEDIASDARMHINIDVNTLSLENEQLKLQMNTAEFLDLQRVDLSHPTCLFTRVE